MIIGDIIFLIVEIIFTLLLIIIAEFAVKLISTKWRICYLLPFAIAIIFVTVNGIEISMLSAYLGVVITLTGFFADSKKLRQMTGVLGVVLIGIAFPICSLYPGYRQPDYVKDFKEGFAAMKEHYVLTEHKGIDFDALYDKYLPRFEEANKHHDEVENYLVWSQFCAEFYDGHVYFVPNSEKTMDEGTARIAGNDYGLSIMTFSSGDYVAVNVDEESEAYADGIHNGTVITAWDGEAIEDVIEKIEYVYFPSPDKDNEAFYSTLLVAGVGGEQVTISYVDDDGKNRDVTVSNSGCFDERMIETLDIIDQGLEAGNMSFTEMDDETVVLRIKSMMFDTNSAKQEDFSGMQNEVRENLLTYKAQGKTRLIVDLRCNGGGHGLMVKALAELLASEGEHFYSYDGLWDDSIGNYAVDPETGKYLKGEGVFYMGEDIWSQGQIIFLVNGQSASAADHFPALLRGQDNVTVMGFTEPCGAGQGVSCKELESGKIYYSVAVMLDENGDILIDSGVDHESGDDIDIKIPFDEEAVRALFDAGEDYVLKRAMELE